MFTLTTAGTPTAENSGQKIGRLISIIYDFRLPFALF